MARKNANNLPTDRAYTAVTLLQKVANAVSMVTLTGTHIKRIDTLEMNGKASLVRIDMAGSLEQTMLLVARACRRVASLSPVAHVGAEALQLQQSNRMHADLNLACLFYFAAGITRKNSVKAAKATRKVYQSFKRWSCVRPSRGCSASP